MTTASTACTIFWTAALLLVQLQLHISFAFTPSSLLGLKSAGHRHAHVGNHFQSFAQKQEHLHNDDDDEQIMISSLSLNGQQPNRREAIEKSSQVLASLLLASSSAASITTNAAVANASDNLDAGSNSNNSPSSSSSSMLKTIVMTGCNSGIGYDAVKRLAADGHTVIMACRTLEKATDAATRIQNELSQQSLKLIPKACNLADLQSINAFVQDLKQNTDISSTSIDALCLNAGIARNTKAKDVLRTKQGFELTIGTNHLGHFYLTQQLLPLLEKDGGNGGKRIVVTASGGECKLRTQFIELD